MIPTWTPVLISKADGDGYNPYRDEDGKFASGPGGGGTAKFALSGKDLGRVFHGGKKKIKEIDPTKLQSRDTGFYGDGFYTTSNPDHAKTYGSKISEYEISPDAKVLYSSLKPEDSPELVEEVKQDYINTFLDRAKSRGKEDALRAEADDLDSSPTVWARAVDAYGVRHGYDIIRHGDGEIVVKNPKVLRFKKALDYSDVHVPRLGDNMPEDYEEDKKDDEEELEKDGTEVIEEIADEIGDKVEDIVEEVLGGGGEDEDADTEKSEDDEDDDLEKCDDGDLKKSDDEDEDDDLEKSEDEEDEDIEKEDEDDEDEKEPDVEKSWTVPLYKSDDQQIVYGVVSEPRSVDLQGDVLTEGEIRKACHAFMMKSQHVGYEHNGPANADIIESYIAPVNFECGGQVVKKGSWVMAVKIHDPILWRAVKKGEINGFSIAGTGTRTPIKS